LIKIFKIFAFLLLAGFVSSCAKDELEAPSQASDAKAIEGAINLNQNVEIMPVDESLDYPATPAPASINDDGDDEDEDRTLSVNPISSKEL
jgi:hypothetical protein